MAEARTWRTSAFDRSDGFETFLLTSTSRSPLLHRIVRGENPQTNTISAIETHGLGTVDLVIQNLLGPPHPFHLHGRPFAIVARGEGVISPEYVRSLFFSGV